MKLSCTLEVLYAAKRQYVAFLTFPARVVRVEIVANFLDAFHPMVERNRCFFGIAKFGDVAEPNSEFPDTAARRSTGFLDVRSIELLAHAAAQRTDLSGIKSTEYLLYIAQYTVPFPGVAVQSTELPDVLRSNDWFH